MPQHRLPSVSITPLSGPSVANIFASLVQRDRHPPSTLYGTSHMSRVEPVSRKRVSRPGAASSNIAAMLNEYTWEGNELRFDAHTLDVFYTYNTSTHS